MTTRRFGAPNLGELRAAGISNIAEIVSVTHACDRWGGGLEPFTALEVRREQSP
jgi:hypothetical protein